MYKQTLYKVHKDHLSKKSIKHQNKHKKFNYGYNHELDCVVISKDGTLGEIYEIQNLKVGLPQTPKKIAGQKLKKGQTVMIVEAMKTMNHVPSTVDGIVSKVLVKDGEPVEFGQPLVSVK